jgi:CRP-like cAMP-binding protein
MSSPIVSSSFRNGGHFRLSDRASGTGDFFAGSFSLPRSKGAFPEILRMVNLRHHVAGMVTTPDSESVCVVPRFEADYAYVATAFIESIRRGLAVCGLEKNSPKGRQIGSDLSTVLYQLASYTGLTRAPKDLDAHDRFCQAYDRHLRANPPSTRIRGMAQEFAKGLIPFTAAKSGETVKGHIQRHLDNETAEYLFPSGEFAQELEEERKEFRRIFMRQKTLPMIVKRSNDRKEIWHRSDVELLHQAYRETVGRPGPANDRLIGAILLNAIMTGRQSNEQLERRKIKLAAGETLIKQGEMLKEMYVVLSSTAPLAVEVQIDQTHDFQQLAILTAPHVLGIMGMWRGQPEASTIFTNVSNTLDVIVINSDRFALLTQESGFQAAMADEVRRRLSLNATVVGKLLTDSTINNEDSLLASIEQLFRYLTGDSHTPLDRVIDLDLDASPAEYVDALRIQVAQAIKDKKFSHELEKCMTNVIWYM